MLSAIKATSISCASGRLSTFVPTSRWSESVLPALRSTSLISSWFTQASSPPSESSSRKGRSAGGTPSRHPNSVGVKPPSTSFASIMVALVDVAVCESKKLCWYLKNAGLAVMYARAMRSCSSPWMRSCRLL